MRIAEWLEREDRTSRWLAEQVGVSQRTAQRWAVGKTIPRNPDHIGKINELSRGQVTANDIIGAPVVNRRVGRPSRQAA